MRELQDALRSLPIGLISLAELDPILAPPESGTTFAENAFQKARYYFERTGTPSLAGDSGLVVPALGGAPGVESARFASGDRARVRKLLSLLQGIPQKARKAYFVCSICLYWSATQQIQVEGRVHGQITQEPRGREGFGYDPVFYYPPLGKTFAELSLTQKGQVSHRGQALRRLRIELEHRIQGTRDPKASQG